MTATATTTRGLNRTGEKTAASTNQQAYRASVRKRRQLVRAAQITVLVVLLGTWQLYVGGDSRKAILFGEPSGIVAQLQTWITQGTSLGSLGDQIKITLEEAFIGFLIGTTLGIVCGIALGRIRFLAEVFSPYIKVLNSIPRIVLGSVFILAFGLGMESKILLVIVLVFFGVFFNAFQGVREVDRNLIANATILGGSRWQVTWHVVLPSAFTWIVASLHVSFGFALIGAIVGEFLGASQGLGQLIKESQGTFNANGVWAAMVIMGIVALAAEWLLTRLENRLLRWRPPQLSGPDL
ncbi:ABC transporter permease [Pengzhenrongella sp.]|jgi:NitT/TauT family transport system permease protein|uniref:ABC transporter permease n=1 Tax=Pengzhenrongella sp. TaxID=2888820 RepID=UPI002F943349